MKKLFLSLAVIGMIFTSCGDDDSPIISTDDDGMMTTDDDGGSVDTILSGQITEDLVLTSDLIWELDGRVTVTNGATLTIEPGTIIKAFAGQEANASVLIIARGAQIQANGTAQQPIIFTSAADGIQIGQTVGTLDENARGLWGGLIVLGNAPISEDGDIEASQIEGIPASDTNGLYGGTDPADSSGSMQYISIRHGGTLIGEGNEINGLTLGGVGTGTVVNHIEVVGNVDDGIEFFGGSVNASNLLVWAQGDDGLDIDQAYSGTITNAAVVQGEISDHALEIDGPEGSLEGSFTIDGLTLIGNATTSNGEYADYRDGAMGETNNVYAVNFPDGKDVELDNNGVAQNYLDGSLSFAAWIVNGPSPANSIFVEKVGCIENCDDDNDDNDVFEDQIILDPSFTERAANWTTAGTSGGADLGAFSWTFASASGGLN
ncbi:MAG: hypothetical protein ABNH00_05635 [Dokdonia sp.]|jgi:hypothetical protein